jgi:DNA ligase-1
MKFDVLVKVYEQLEEISSGNKMREILAEFFKKVPKDTIAMVSYLTLGRIASAYDNVVLGIAEKSVLKSIAVAGGTELAKVKRLLRETGDAGLAAENVLKKKPQTLVPLGTLTVDELFKKLHGIADVSGAGSQEAKMNTLAALLQKTSPQGAKYIVRIVLGTLRIGVGDMTLLDALALAFTGEKKNKELLEHAYNICPDVGVIAETLARKGLSGVKRIDVHVGRPIKMMLAQRVKTWDEVAKKIPGTLAVEAKYDGERVQAHKNKKGTITLFSRRLENISSQFPDLVTYIRNHVSGKEFVVEAEVIAIDKRGHHLPFQTLMQRRRKYEVERYVKKIPIQAKMFDLLYFNGTSYLHTPYSTRVAQLKKIVKRGKHITLADRIVTDDMKKIKNFFQQMISEGYEGIMIKSLDGEYQAGTRGWNWIKWKKEYAEEISDTFDLVIVGAYHGRGKRKGTYGALLCAAYDKKNDTFETFCKLGTGLTDEMLATLPKMLKKYIVERKPARLNVKKEMEPDVWFEPRVVVEVLGAEITKSPYHTCAGGLALRFPRFVRFREDKNAEQATTSTEIKHMAGK